MNLKQHNNIVQKLIQQIDNKDKQITLLNKQLSQQSKTINSTNPSINPAQTQKLIQKKISQLNKQHQTKLTQLNQQIKQLTQQNTQLKQRLNLKQALQNKQKQRVAQILKKSVIDRKAGSKEDYKISALISHYQNQISRKNGFIETLKRQLKAVSINSNNTPLLKDLSKQQQQHQQQQNDQSNIDCANTNNTTNNKTIPILQHTKQISNLNKQISTLSNRLKLTQKELQSTKTNYNQLTKQYYRLINQHGASSTTTSNKHFQKTLTNNIKNNLHKDKFTALRQSPQFIPTQPNHNNNASLLFNLSQDNSFSNQNQFNNFINDTSSMSLTFQQNFKKFINRPKINQSSQQHNQILQTNNNNITISKHLPNKSQQQKSYNYYKQLQQLYQSILSTLNLTSKHDIIPHLTQLQQKVNSHQLNQKILQQLHQFLYQFGFGKVPKTQMTQILRKLSQKYHKLIQSNDLLDQVCIQIGAKRNKLIDKINSYKSLQQQYLNKMKNIQFLNQLNKAQKLLQFINFFQLDKSNLQLPQQLKNIYQQLKHVDRFMKLANSILCIEIKDRKGLESTLQLILKKLQKYYSWQVELEKENQRKLNIKKMQREKQQKQVKQYE